MFELFYAIFVEIDSEMFRTEIFRTKMFRTEMFEQFRTVLAEGFLVMIELGFNHDVSST